MQKRNGHLVQLDRVEEGSDPSLSALYKVGAACDAFFARKGIPNLTMRDMITGSVGSDKKKVKRKS